MVATEKWMREKYAKFNHMLFGGKLPSIRLVINNRLKNAWGRACAKYDFSNFKMIPTHIEMINKMDCPEEVLCSTLVHEMIHIYDYSFFPEHYIKRTFYGGCEKVRNYDAHGSWFLGECSRINAMNIGLKVSQTVTTEEQAVSKISDDFKEKKKKQVEKGYYVQIVKYNDESASTFKMWGQMKKLSKERFESYMTQDNFYTSEPYYRKYCKSVGFYICHDIDASLLRANGRGKYITFEKKDELLSNSKLVKNIEIPSGKQEAKRGAISLANTFKEQLKRLIKDNGVTAKSKRLNLESDYVVDEVTGLRVQTSLLMSNVYLTVEKETMYICKLSEIRQTLTEMERLAIVIGNRFKDKILGENHMIKYNKIIREIVDDYVNNQGGGNEITIQGAPGQRVFNKKKSSGVEIIGIE